MLVPWRAAPLSACRRRWAVPSAAASAPPAGSGYVGTSQPRRSSIRSFTSPASCARRASAGSPTSSSWAWARPFHNYDETLRACRLLNDPTGFGLAARAISVSTAGSCRASTGSPPSRCSSTWRSACTRPPTTCATASCLSTGHTRSPALRRMRPDAERTRRKLSSRRGRRRTPPGGGRRAGAGGGGGRGGGPAAASRVGGAPGGKGGRSEGGAAGGGGARRGPGARGRGEGDARGGGGGGGGGVGGRRGSPPQPLRPARGR